MRILPTSPKPEVLSTMTYPAPPNKDKGIATYTEARDYGGSKLKPRLQRTYWNGNARNTLTAPPVLLADWVIEEEIPTAPITFLSYPTRRCFLEDQIQIRVQIGGMTMGATAHVNLTVERLGRISNDKALFLSTDPARVNAATGYWAKEQRPLTVSNDIAAETLAHASANILYEISNTDNKISFVCTSIRLPPPPNDMETEEEEYVFRVKVFMNGHTYETKSPVLRALRWWARPSKNLDQPKTNASLITPLVDGEVYFNKCEQMIRGAANSICITGWGLYMDTLLTNMPNMNGVMLSALLLQKANAGVQVYIILGELMNGNNTLRGFRSRLLEYNAGPDDDKNDLTNYTQKCESLLHPNIHFKLHKHPLEIAGNTLGSYHEKYVVTDTDKAAVGGIDFQPNRYQSQAHDWKMDSDAFDELSAMRMRYNAGPGTKGRELYDEGASAGFGVAAANGHAVYTLPTYLPADAERAILAWFEPNVVTLDVSHAGTDETCTIGGSPKRPYYYLYADGARIDSDLVPDDRIVPYNLPGGTLAAELVWWDLDEPEIVDLNFAHKGTAETYAIQRKGAPCAKALWMVKVPKLESTIDGTVEDGEGMRWHDAGVYVEGDVVKNVRHDFVRRWNLAGDDLGCVQPADRVARLTMPACVQTANPTTHNSQVVKTGDYALRTDCKHQGTWDVYKQAIRQARHYIYIENQYFAWPGLGDELCDALERNPGLQVMVVVPFYTEEAANMADDRFESMNVWSMLGKLIRGTVDQKAMKDRGVRHQQFQQAQLIARLRAVAGAANRVGIYVMAGNLQEHRVARPIVKTLRYSDNNKPIDGAVWSFEVGGVEQAHGITTLDGEVPFTIPANAKRPILKWDLPEPPAIEDLPLDHAGTLENRILQDSALQPLDGARWRINYRREATSPKNRTDASGDADFTIPADADDATLRYWRPIRVKLSVRDAGTRKSVVLKADGINPTDRMTWLLVVDGVDGPSGTTGPDGKVRYTLPRGTRRAHILGWQLDEPPEEEELDVVNKGTPETFTILDSGGVNPEEDAVWELLVFRYGEILGTTGPDGQVDYTLPADTAFARLRFQPKPVDYKFEIDYPCADMIYPHSKLMIVDDTWAIVGSANANGRSFVTDEEINIVFHDRTSVTALRRSLWHEHLGIHLDTRDIRTFFATWKSRALPAVETPEDVDPAQANTIHVVNLGKPLAGQEYNGPLSSMVDMDKLV